MVSVTWESLAGRTERIAFPSWNEFKDCRVRYLKRQIAYKIDRWDFKLYCNNVELPEGDTLEDRVDRDSELVARQVIRSDESQPEPPGARLTILWLGEIETFGWEFVSRFTVKYLISKFNINNANIQLFLFWNPYEPLYPEAILRDCLGEERALIGHYQPLLPLLSRPRLPHEQGLTSIEIVTILEGKPDPCSICLEELIISDYAETNQIYRTKKCRHLFHGACIQGWMTAKRDALCPLCRSRL